MKKRASYFTTAVLAVSASISLSSCTGSKTGGSDSVLRLPMVTDAKSLDPAMVDDLYSNEATSLIYEGLVEYEYLKRPHELRPLLAAELPTVSKDELTYTFKIKKGAKFQDSDAFEGGKGRDVKASDFVYSFLRIADPKINSGGFWIFDGKIKGLNDWREAQKTADKVAYDAGPEGFKALDDETLQITLVQKYPQLLYVLAMPYGFVVPREAVEKHGKDFTNKPTGTGPYKLVNWMRGSKITYERNPSYHGSKYPTAGESTDSEALLTDAGKDLPFTDKVEMHIFTESQPMWLNFLSGSLDRVGIPKDNFESVIDPSNNSLKPDFKNKGIELTITPTPDVTYIAFNQEDPFFKKAGPDFRKAIAMAIDGERQIRVFYNGRAILAHTPVPPGLAGYDADFKNPYQKYDVAGAKALLAKAGYPEGKGIPPMNYEIGQGSDSRQLAEAVQRDLAVIGIKLNINVNQFSELLSKIDSKKAQMWGIAWGADYPDAENFLQLLYGPNAAPGPNGANYNSAEYNKLFEQMRFMRDSPERRTIIRQMQEVFVRDLPWAPGVHRIAYSLGHAWLGNYKPGYMGGNVAKFLKVNTERRAQGLK
jgi:oligopeptide transport system substrate-binding protein